jgi:probable F420-dependent oxidoreductase
VKVAYGFPFHTAPPPPYLLDGQNLADLAVLVEECGFAAAWLTEHPVPGQAWRESGGHDALDPFVGLGLVAAATSTLRLLTYLAVVPYRNPFLLAKSVATLDVLSGGRVELGMGAGYMKSEFVALGVNFDERNTRFDESLEVMKLAWQGEPVNFEGNGISAHNVTSFPATVQQPHPPLWFGGNSQRTLRRVVAHGRGWMPLPNARDTARFLRSPALETLDDLAVLLERLHELAAQAGRTDPIDVMYWLPTVHEPADMALHVDLAQRARELGVTWFVVNGEGTTIHEARGFVERYRERVLRRLEVP